MAKQLDFENGNFDLSSATDDVLDKYAAFLSKQDDREEERNRVVAAHKTVGTFSGLIGRRMHLKSSKAAYTDGVEIGAPFDSPYLYEIVEHEIAHNLFKSNFEAKQTFCEQYVLQVSKALTAFGSSMSVQQQDQIKSMVGTILNIIEDHRVNSLWAMLYPGSYKRLMEHSHDLVHRRRKAAHENIINFFLMVAYDVKPLPKGQYDRFAPAMVAALKQVERKGPGSTFVVGKWLMTQIVSEMIRISKNLPPPPQAGSSKVKTDLDDMGDQIFQPNPQSGDGDGDGDGEDGDEGGQQASAGRSGSGQGDDDGDDGDDEGDEADDADGSSGQAAASGAGGDKQDKPWTPPPVNATAEERVDAFKGLLDAAKKMAEQTQAMASALSRVNNGQTSSPALAQGAQADARQLVAAAYNTDVTDDKALADYLEKSAEYMEGVVEKIREALETEGDQSEQEWCARNINDKVKFREIDRARVSPQPLSPDDMRTVGRMREIFQRVKSRATKMLADDGMDVDIPALIQRRVSDHPMPIFKADVNGRGFKALVLVDRSSSMEGPPSAATERASRILRASLKQPNVQFHVWGFHGDHNGCVISRVAPNLDVADSREMPATGNTPMHAAVRAAVNFLTEGYEKKQLILITDGEPNHNDDPLNGGKNRFTAVRREIQRARRMGVNVTTLVIGSGVSREAANTMFGDDKQWTRVKDDPSLTFKGLTKSLVQVVSSSFARYLQSG